MTEKGKDYDCIYNHGIREYILQYPYAKYAESELIRISRNNSVIVIPKTLIVTIAKDLLWGDTNKRRK